MSSTMASIIKSMATRICSQVQIIILRAKAMELKGTQMFYKAKKIWLQVPEIKSEE
jgi:hypothetical protein